ncbi:hypothetical protein ACE414_02025 [Alteromonas macleodii]|uniref:hypothetical protein n=1 Tax=Alteromonas macleodii TaxID=28108 RepID=UPI003648761D
MAQSSKRTYGQLVENWFLRNYKAVCIIGGAVIGLLSFYDTMRQQGKSFVCDMPYMSGWSWLKCQQLSQSQIEWLMQLDKDGKLSSIQRELLEKEEHRLINNLLERLAEPISEDEPEARAATELVIINKLDEAEPSELNALELISNGKTDEGLANLEAQAVEAQSNATKNGVS